MMASMSTYALAMLIKAENLIVDSSLSCRVIQKVSSSVLSPFWGHPRGTPPPPSPFSPTITPALGKVLEYETLLCDHYINIINYFNNKQLWTIYNIRVCKF